MAARPACRISPGPYAGANAAGRRQLVDQPKRRRALRRSQSRLTSPAADIRSLPPSEGSVPGPSAEQDMGCSIERSCIRTTAAELGVGAGVGDFAGRARVPPVAIDNRNAQDQEPPAGSSPRGALSEQKRTLLAPLVQASARKTAAIDQASLRMTILLLRHLRRTTTQRLNRQHKRLLARLYSRIDHALQRRRVLADQAAAAVNR